MPTMKTTRKLDASKQESFYSPTCKHCGKLFKATVYWQKFCSLKCRHAYQYQITKL